MNTSSNSDTGNGQNNETLYSSIELFRLDYQIANDKISHFDRIIFQVKGWLITLWFAILFITLETNRNAIFLTLLPIFIFGVIEYKYKLYQKALIFYVENLEDLAKKEFSMGYPHHGLFFKEKFYPNRTTDDIFKKNINYNIMLDSNFFYPYSALLLTSFIVILHLFVFSLNLIVIVIILLIYIIICLLRTCVRR